MTHLISSLAAYAIKSLKLSAIKLIGTTRNSEGDCHAIEIYLVFFNYFKKTLRILQLSCIGIKFNWRIAK